MRFFEEDNNLQQNEESALPQVQKLVNGINLKDLLDGKDVLFEISHDYDEVANNLNVSDDESEEVRSFVKLRLKRGSPDCSSNFSAVASSMVSLDKHGYVKKEVINCGRGSTPSDHSKVLVHYNFYKEKDEEPFDSTYLRGKPCRFYLDEGQIIPGLELAIKSMKKGENSRFFIKWEAAFGRQGCPPRIEKECDILADVTLLDYTQVIDDSECEGMTEKDINTSRFEKTIKEAKNCHCWGNEEFAAGKIKGAIKSYRKCVNILNEMRLVNEEEEKKMLNLKVKCLVNLAVCYNKISQYEKACVVCRDALSISPDSIKAAFQYGKANLKLSNLGIAEKWLVKAKKMKPEDKDIRNELEKLHLKKETTQLEDTLFCQRIFSDVTATASNANNNNNNKKNNN